MSVKTQHLTQTAPVEEEQKLNQNSFYLDEYIYIGKTKISLRCALLKSAVCTSSHLLPQVLYDSDKNPQVAVHSI